MHGVPPRSGIERERPEGERQGLWLHGGLCDVSSVNEAGGIGQKQAQILEIENNIMGVVNIYYPKNKKYYVFFEKSYKIIRVGSYINDIKMDRFLVDRLLDLEVEA